MRDRDRTGGLKRLVRKKDLLDLCRENRHAGYFDDPLETLLKVEESVIITVAEVTGVYPSSSVFMDVDREVRRLRIIQISQHDRRSGDAYLAFFSVRYFFICSRLDDLHIDGRQRKSDRSCSAILFRVNGADGDRLGQSVSLTKGDMAASFGNKCLEAVFQVHRKAITADKARDQEVQLHVADLFTLHHALIQRRHGSDQLRLLLTDDLTEFFRLKDWHQKNIDPVH